MNPSGSDSRLCSLPNEVHSPDQCDAATRTEHANHHAQLLYQTFSLLPLAQLLPLSTLSRRYHALVCRMLRNRLHAAADFTSRAMLVECYHPSARLTEPSLDCAYLGTDGLEDLACFRHTKTDGHDEPCIPAQDLAKLNGLYSRFRPYRRQSKQPRRSLPGDIPGSRTYSAPNAGGASTATASSPDGAAAASRSPSNPDPEASAYDLPPLVTHLIHFDGGEAFNQLVINTILVKPSTMNGLYTSYIPTSTGWLRVFRRWLEERLADAHEGVPRDAGGNILWVGLGHDIGMRFSVRRTAWRRGAADGGPLLMRADEEAPASFELVYEGMSCSFCATGTRSLARC